MTRVRTRWHARVVAVRRYVGGFHDNVQHGVGVLLSPFRGSPEQEADPGMDGAGPVAGPDSIVLSRAGSRAGSLGGDEYEAGSDAPPAAPLLEDAAPDTALPDVDATSPSRGRSNAPFGDDDELNGDAIIALSGAQSPVRGALPQRRRDLSARERRRPRPIMEQTWWRDGTEPTDVFDCLARRGVWREGVHLYWMGESYPNTPSTEDFLRHFAASVPHHYTNHFAMLVANNLPYMPEGVDPRDPRVVGVLRRVIAGSASVVASSGHKRAKREVAAVTSRLAALEQRRKVELATDIKAFSECRAAEEAVGKQRAHLALVTARCALLTNELEAFWTEDAEKVRDKYEAAVAVLNSVERKDWIIVRAPAAAGAASRVLLAPSQTMLCACARGARLQLRQLRMPLAPALVLFINAFADIVNVQPLLGQVKLMFYDNTVNAACAAGAPRGL